MLESWLVVPEQVASERLAVLALAVALECAFAEVPASVHPVVWMGRLTHGFLRFEPQPPRAQLAFGVLLTLLGASLIGTLVVSLVSVIAFPWRIAVEALLLHTTFSVHGLALAGKRMRLALGQSLAEGRQALSHLCSRDARTLTEPELVGATIESLTENTCDSYVAPLFYFAALGIPAAVIYRFVNTLDSMIGYRGRYEYTGKFAARLDDVLNYVPARLSALLLLLVGAVRGYAARNALQTYRTEHVKTASPNAGVTMSVAAGLLGVVLEKEGHYRLIGGSQLPQASQIAEVERWVVWVFASCVFTLACVLAVSARLG